MTVHAPIGEFDEEGESDCMSNEDFSDSDGDEEEAVQIREETDKHDFSEKSQNIPKPGCSNPNNESEDEIIARYSNNPNFKSLVQRLLGGPSQNDVGQEPPLEIGDTRNIQVRHDGPPARKRIQTETTTRPMQEGTNEMIQTPVKATNNFVKQNASKIKSPSDTIYAPGLQRISQMETYNGHMLDKISNFVESVHHEVTGGSQLPTMTHGETTQATQMAQFSQADEARKEADKLILDAEHFRASVTAPTGSEQMVFQENNANDLCGGDFPRTVCNPVMDNDDDFFHLTCHIEPNLRSKIERGDFVDLEKLLPRNKFPHRLSREGKLELVNKDGMTYFVPATDKDNSINGIKRSDQAFRVYAAIYCKFGSMCLPSTLLHPHSSGIM